jgi:hypothetical protein
LIEYFESLNRRLSPINTTDKPSKNKYKLANSPVLEENQTKELLTMNIARLLLGFFIVISASTTSAQEFVDDFSVAELEGRLAERGEWKFENKEANCAADPELYKQFMNHGPILKWPREFHDATIQFEMKPTDCQRVVFTLNGEGHIFRVTLADETSNSPAGKSKVPTRIIAWAAQSSKENKGDTLKPEGLPDLPAINNKWVKVKLSIAGDQAKLRIGDFKTDIKHLAINRDKNMVMLTFAHGELAVRNFKMVSSKRPAILEDRTSRCVQAGETKALFGYFMQKSLVVGSDQKVPLVISLHGAGGGKKGVDGIPVRRL